MWKEWSIKEKSPWKYIKRVKKFNIEKYIKKMLLKNW